MFVLSPASDTPISITINSQISHVSDDHVPSLSESSGPWKVGSTHRARVIGFSLLDGLLKLSLKPSVIDQLYLRPTDLAVGEIIKGTVKNLSGLGLFVTIADGVDGVVWPLHYSDIKLKNPERKFKVGDTIRCRVSPFSSCDFQYSHLWWLVSRCSMWTGSAIE